MLNTGQGYTVDDIQLLSQIILYNLLDPHGQPQIGIEYMKNYNLTVKDIEKLIKVDKLSDKYKKLYTSRQKTQLARSFGQMTQKEIHSTKFNLGRTHGKMKIDEDKSDSEEQPGSSEKAEVELDEKEEEEEIEEVAEELDENGK
jgi:hypothetical protein